MALRRALSGADATWIVVGSMVGAGIFIFPGIVAGQLPGPGWVLAAWAAGGLLALAGAAVYAELGARFPEAGGDYRFLHASLGPLPAFLTGWAAFLLTFSAAAAAMAIAVVDHAREALLGPGGSGGEGGLASRLAGVAVILILTAANAAGSRLAGRTTMLLTALPLAGLAALFAWGLASGHEGVSWPSAAAGGASRPGGLAAGLMALGAALVPVFFTYSGWSAAAYVAGEVRDAPRVLPWALLAGTGLVTLLYLAVNGVLLASLPPAELAGSTTAVGDAARRLLGPAAGRPMAGVIALAVLGSANVTLMAGARIYFAMAGDGLAPRALGRVSPAGVPATALWLSAVWSALLAASGSIQRLASWVTLAMLLLSSLTVAGLFVLRRRDAPGSSPPFRCPGYPVTPLLYLAASLWVAAGSILHDPWGGLSGLALVAAGVPVYLVAARGGRSGPAPTGRTSRPPGRW